MAEQEQTQTQSPEPQPKAPKKRRHWGRRLSIAAGVLFVLVGATWYAIHHVPGFGPALADGVRAVLGPSAVAWIEDTAYGIADRINVWRHGDEAPTSLWDPQQASSAAPALPAPEPAPIVDPDAGTLTKAAFPPARFEPPFPAVVAEGDGTWLVMPEGSHEGEMPVMVKAIVHPDPKRPFAAVAVVAMDLTRIDIRLIAGTTEPVSTKVTLSERPGTIPAADQPSLIAVFNGGFKALHGQYGMMLEGKTFLPPRDIACTVGLYKDASIRIRTWPTLAPTETEMVAYRQTPGCLVEQGELNAKLSDVNKNWGATVSGETIIRRSAIGIDKTGKTLFYGLGEAVTAQSLARGMKAVGAEDAAQLDVNYAYPRFLLFDHPPGAERRALASLVPHVDYRSRDYVRDPSPRDFFYVKRKSP